MRKVLKAGIGATFGFLLLASVVVPIFIPYITGWTHYYVEPGIYEALENFDKDNLANQFEIHIWRDFMPSWDYEHDRLRMRVYYSCPNVIKRVWITDGENFSSSPASKLFSNEYGNGMYWSGGPKWDTGIYIDVVIKIQIRYHTFYLVAKHQYIYETW